MREESKSIGTQREGSGGCHQGRAEKDGFSQDGQREDDVDGGGAIARDDKER